MKNNDKKIFNNTVLAHWHENFKKLVDFKNKFGNCDVPYLWSEDESLAQWVHIQRKTKNKLPDDLKSSLLSIEFDFSESPFIWEEKYEELYQFKKENGHIFLPHGDPKYDNLKDWVGVQILNKNYLTEERFNKLNSLGVAWESKTLRDSKWEAMLGKLVEFKKNHGHCMVPQNWSENPQLSNWVCVQRRTAVSGKLNKDRKVKLDKLEFVWRFQDIYDTVWEQNFDLLHEFKKQYGHCKVPGKFEGLSSWIDRQRTAKNNGKLSKKREKRLIELGFIWDFKAINENKWKEKHQLLTAFKKKYGHCFVPVNWKENRSLGNWVATQRRLEEKGSLDPKKKVILNKMGFIWRKEALNQLNAIYESQWEDNYKKLKLYNKKHGTCQVSLKIDPRLQRWTSLQRRLFKQHHLSEERINKLNKLQFPWDTHKAYWLKMYKELLNFHRQNGHFKVPWGWKKDPHLAPWIQRIRLNKHELDKKKIKLLDAIGFDWTRKKRTIISWEEMYFKLKQFKETYGHTRVPVQWNKDEKLGKWVSRMRYEGKEMRKDRKQLLMGINFDWGKGNANEEKDTKDMATVY